MPTTYVAKGQNGLEDLFFKVFFFFFPEMGEGVGKHHQMQLSVPLLAILNCYSRHSVENCQCLMGTNEFTVYRFRGGNVDT